jgi:replication factor A1
VRTKPSPSDYLAFLSVKHEVEPDQFFKALVSAAERRESRCGSLTIECRQKTGNDYTFLFQKDSKVVAQFPIPQSYLLQTSNPMKDLPKTDLIRRQLNKKNRDSRCKLIRDLRAGMTQINLKARVVEIPKPKLVYTRFGNYANVSNALIADETGTIKLCLWNDQINSVAEGDTIHLKNARMTAFKGEKQLNIGKKGTLNNIKDLSAPLAKV